MVSTLGTTSSKVAEYFTTEIAPVVRTQITDLFKNGTQILSYTSWDSAADLRAQPRITIELEGFEELLELNPVTSLMTKLLKQYWHQMI